MKRVSPATPPRPRTPTLIGLHPTVRGPFLRPVGRYRLVNGRSKP